MVHTEAIDLAFPSSVDEMWPASVARRRPVVSDSLVLVAKIRCTCRMAVRREYRVRSWDFVVHHLCSTSYECDDSDGRGVGICPIPSDDLDFCHVLAGPGSPGLATLRHRVAVCPSLLPSKNGNRTGQKCGRRALKISRWASCSVVTSIVHLTVDSQYLDGTVCKCPLGTGGRARLRRLQQMSQNAFALFPVSITSLHSCITLKS